MATLVTFTAWNDVGSTTYKLAVNPAHVASVAEYVSADGHRWALLELVTGQQHRLFKMQHGEAVERLRLEGDAAL